ncbi:hypothetical protein MNBD_GAMMA15-2360 [hydrothermal vent metagenome]|uniref:AAA+ ATPase domain-containing protein n=1 Tax=hydrothermal vent metagenome TaxID=652676 RepID=A0A3B0YPJ1_9ZZZZ
MYANFYGFRENPFSLLPDPDFLYLSEQHEQALNLLQLAAINRSGFCAISGAPGTGKSTLIRALLSSLDDNVCTGLITDTYSSFSELLNRILIAFDLDCAETDDVSRYKRFTDFVIRQYASNRNVLLIVDEAQNLEHGVLEQLRMLSNINADKSAMIQIMLIGQESLQEKLKSPRLKQLAQRIECNHQLFPLDANETCAYIRHRVGKAGGSAELFSDKACKLIYMKSGGIPRNINRICDLALVYGYAADEHNISADIVAAAARKQFSDKPDSQPAAKPQVVKTSSVEPVEPPTQPVTPDDTPDTKVVDDIIDTQDAMAEAAAKKSAAIAKLTLAIETAQLATQESESLCIAAQRANAKHADARKALSKHTENHDHAIQQLESSRADVEKISAEKTGAEKTATKLEELAVATQQRVHDEETAIVQQLEETRRADLHAIETAKAAALEAEKTLQERIEAERIAAEVLAETESAAKQARKTLLEAESQAVERSAELSAEAEKAEVEQKLAFEAARHTSGQLLTATETVKQAEELALKLAAEKDEAGATTERQAKITQDISEQAVQAETAAQQAEEARLEAEQYAATQITAEKVLAAELAGDLARAARQEADQAAASKAAALRMAQEKEELARSAAEQAARAKAEADLATGAEIRILMNEEEVAASESAADEEDTTPTPAPQAPEISQQELNTVTRLAAEARSRQKRKSTLSLIAASAAGILLISWATLEINKPDEVQSAKIPAKAEAAALEILREDAPSNN